MNIRLDLSKRRFVFLFGITAVYLSLVVWLDWLSGPPIWDERTYWQASLFFSDRAIPTLQDLNNYGELNTPLPFIVFGAIERWFDLGIAAGRWLNLLLSLGIAFAIGWPRRLEKGSRLFNVLCLVGLLSYPYFLFASARLYTDMMACFWVLAGYIGYVRNRHLLSSGAFILAIASRQYMLAFPLAIAVYELAVVLLGPKMVGDRAAQAADAEVSVESVASRSTLGDGAFSKLVVSESVVSESVIDKSVIGESTIGESVAFEKTTARLALWWPAIAALIAVFSLAGWVYIFGGLTPKTAAIHSIQTSSSTSWAATQRTLWSIRPGIALNFLSYVGLYIVIPEWLLFWANKKSVSFSRIRQRWRSVAICLGLLLLLFCLFPPLVKDHGLLAKLVYGLPAGFAQNLPLYALASLACIRFSRFEPLTLMVLFNSLIMMKAHPWDKYILPLTVVFWYAKSAGLADKSSRFFQYSDAR